MVEIIKQHRDKRVSPEEAKGQYPNCNFLLVDIVGTNNSLRGVVYAISKTPETLRELVILEDELQENGYETFIGGEYTDSIF